MAASGTEGSRLKLIVCFLGIFVSYFVYGILQEKITKGRYGDEQERFTFTLALVCVQCIINAIFAKVSLGLVPSGNDKTPQRLYITMVFSYLGAMLCSNGALQWVSYPTQVLGKSIKPIPVMILGVLLARKRYPLQKYLFVFMIVMGVALFMYKDKKSKHIDADHTLGVGELLLIGSLLLDGFTGATQDKMRSNYQTKTHHLMYNVNYWSVLLLLIALTLTGEGVAFLIFTQKHPTVLISMLSFSLASAVGQNFIFMTVTNFGPLTTSIFTTTRKFFTILGSVLIFQHPMSGRQWFGTVLVFAGLILDNLYGKERKQAKHVLPAAHRDVQSRDYLLHPDDEPWLHRTGLHGVLTRTPHRAR